MQEKKTLTPVGFQALLSSLCDAETSMDSAGWTAKNPLWGHCAVVSLVAHNLFGGRLLRASLVGTPFAGAESHYWNELSDGTIIDFTAPQFGNRYPDLTHRVETRTRAYVLFDPKTGIPREITKRYKLLCWRLAKALYTNNALFERYDVSRMFFCRFGFSMPEVVIWVCYYA